MINVTFDKSEQNLRGFEFDGHAGYADSGKDIVCAGVSALVLNMINSVEEFCEDKYMLDIDEESGHVRFTFVDEPSYNAILLINSLELGIKGIKETYSQHITLDYREV
ncbi:MAG: ribosomal-processing cysteine protease Prp [Lachnospiraceae bacterium]|nr:ribosomal-processing cysteine protease Prp [Lachnospiraceae bacterium]